MRKLVFGWVWTLCLVSFFTKGFSQGEMTVPIPSHPFLNLAENKIQFPGDSGSLERFFLALDRLMVEGEGQVQILHMGGSHVQADVFSDRMRQHFQTFYPGNRGSRGLLFPFRLAGTNSPANFSVATSGAWSTCKNTQRTGCPLGITGYSATTRDSFATLDFSFKTVGPAYDFNRIRVLHDTSDTRTQVFVRGDSLAKRLEGKGYTEFLLSQFSPSFSLEFRKTDSLQNHFTLFGVLAENTDPGIYYHGAGVNGASVPSWLDCQWVGPHMGLIQPNLVIFAIGINDANGPAFDPSAFERNYDQLIARIKAFSPNTQFLFIVNNDCYYKKRYVNKNTPKVREAMFRLAKRHGAAVWDLFSVMGGLNSSRKWELAGLMQRDKVHFTNPGYQLVGDLLFNALVAAYFDHMRHHPYLGGLN